MPVIIELKDEEENELQHYGILRKSGRYPWGSGDTQYARNRGFLDYYNEMKKAGNSDKDIADVLSGETKSEEVSITLLRDAKMIALNQNKLEDYHTAKKLSDKGWSNEAIAKHMGKAGESSIRALLAPGVKDKLEKKLSTINMLKEEVDRKGAVDIGRGVESNIGISAEQLRAAASALREQGYNRYTVKEKVGTTGHETKRVVLAKPEIPWRDIARDKSIIKQIDQVTSNDGRSFGPSKKHPLVSIDPKRVSVVYGDEGGSKADGVVFVRPGKEDLSLGKNRYAQVRIKVGDDHYIKGMAVYKDDLPKGVDLLFNTNKTRADAAKEASLRGDKDVKLGALKLLEKENKDYPFGSVVKPQIVDKHKDTERVVSAMNFVNEEGDWRKWSRNVSAQALSKQPPSLAKEQLNMTYKARRAGYDEIMALTNPVVKKKLLKNFSDEVDKSAVHLKAAALDRQNWHVILPVDGLKSNEIYAPKYSHGETVVLIRYPHGGKFEIPEVRVNNRNRKALDMLGTDPLDAIGIHPSVAQRLSGADFDGDTVLVIPNNNKRIKVDPALEGLKNFDAKRDYKLPPGHKSRIHTQQEMGKVSNLITDMTLMGAPNSEIARAVKHSMVVIDAAKHDLDHKRSERDFAISELKKQYQGGSKAGASTLISKAKSRVDLPERKPRLHKDGGAINKETGALEFVLTGKVKRNLDGTPRLKKDGTPDYVTQQHKKLAVTDDAHTLSSGTRMEKIYADHSNKMKDLANQARLSMINQPKMQISRSAKKAYAKEVESLDSKLALAKRNAPRERQAQTIANQIVAAEKAANPTLDKGTIKKITFRAQEEARLRMGVETKPIKITKQEWAAIQAGAISESKLSQILDKADLEIVKQLATPRHVKAMSPADKQLALRLLTINGLSRAEVAKRLGVSVSTLDAYTIQDAKDDDDEEYDD